MAQQRREEVSGRGPTPLHSKMSYIGAPTLLRNRTSCIGALKVHRSHHVQRPTVSEEMEDISTKTILLPHQALGPSTIRSSMAPRNRTTVHSLQVLQPALLVLLISHIYRLLISQLAIRNSQVTGVNLTQHPRPTPRISLLPHHHPDQSNRGMVVTCLP